MSMTESYLRHTISLHSFFVECFVFFHTVLFKWLCSSLGGCQEIVQSVVLNTSVIIARA